MYCELLAKLNQDISLLTVNRRLSHYLHHEYAQYKINTEGKKIWPTPSILPLNAWLTHCWQRCPKASAILLTDFQEQQLWQKIIPLSNKTARLAKQAWHLMKSWNLSLSDLAVEANSEVECFIQWALQFESLLKEKKWISSAELPSQLEKLIPYLKLPTQIILLGFDELPPSTQQLFCKLEKKVSIQFNSLIDGYSFNTEEKRLSPSLADSPKLTTVVNQLSLKDRENEIQTMARWSLAQWHHHPTQKIACIVPNLEQSRPLLTRIFTETFKSDKLFNISIGEPLFHIPLVKIAISVLALDFSTIDIFQLAVVSGSVYINSTDDDRCLAAMLDTHLRKLKQWTISCEKLLYHIDQLQNNFKYSTLKIRYQQWFNAVHTTISSQYPSQWIQTFANELSAIGWPGQHTLNSKEYQELKRWNQLLLEFSALDLIIGKLTRESAVHLLRQLAQHIIFQPKTNSKAPIQILGLLETAGQRFDKVWLMGLDERNWPPIAKPNPFLPINLQRQHKMPHSSAKRETDYAIQLQQRVLNSAPLVILSTIQQESDVKLSPSPLIRNFPKITLDELHLPFLQSLDEFLFNTQKIETFTDESPSVKKNESIKGGSTLLQSQSVCPFQAFAKIRLNAKSLETPYMGLNSADQGHFIHAALDLIWKKIKDWDTLNTYTDSLLEEIVIKAIDQIFIQEAPSLFIQVEKKRIQRLIKKWLMLEKKRAPFEVTQHETERHITVGPLNLRIRIDRIDKIGNSYFIIDYKTGTRNKPEDWLGQRLKQVQLPLYSAFSEYEVNGMAYAEIHSLKMKFNGLIDPTEKYLFSEITASSKSWDQLNQQWKIQLEQLAFDFFNGKAEVNPLNEETCKYCDLSTLCRIGEKK